MDKEIFILLRAQAIEVLRSLLAAREFASEKGLHDDVERINASITENKCILSLANHQLSDLKEAGTTKRMGFFETV